MIKNFYPRLVVQLTVSGFVLIRLLWGAPGPSFLEPDLRLQSIRLHTKFLADDLLEGRAPGTRGGELAARYIATQFQLAGLEPANGDSFYQMVPLVGTIVDPTMVLTITGKEESLTLNYGKDFVAWAGEEQEKVVLSGQSLVFVGYGVSAPEVPWDDYKDVDLGGKVLLMLVNDPPSDDPGFFGGKALTYYGRWTYKLEEAARRGAAGAILIHNDDMAGYPWGVVENSWSGGQFSLSSQGPSTPRVEAWIREEHADRLLRSRGLSFKEAHRLAGRADFEPIPLDLSVSIEVVSTIQSTESPNVVGMLRGRDPKLKDEVILITSHYDHLGVGSEVAGDSVYNGALDNASGTGGLLELAAAFARYPERPRRTVLFAAVTAEEQGLLGSKYYAAHPLVPLSKTAANINVDSINVWGRTENIAALGAERSTIESVIHQVAKKMNMVVSPDVFPEKGLFFRSDQFSLVKVGVPSIFLIRGNRFMGKPPNWGKELTREYTAKHYHQPSDEFDPSWSFEGAAQMMEFTFWTTLHLANQEAMPQWKPGDPFEAVRKKVLATDR